MTNWRLLESEIVDILRREGFAIDENVEGDKIIPDSAVDMPELNISYFARELASRVELKAQAVKVTT